METEMFDRGLAAAVREMHAQSGLQSTMDAATDLVPELIENCDLAGVSIIRRQGIETLSATDPLLREIEQMQFTFSEGPCYDALGENELVHSTNLAEDPRWPAWGPKVAGELGLYSSLSYRLFASRGTLGSLNLYSRTPDAFDSDAVHEGVAIAAQVAVALAHAQHSEGMDTALRGRTVIGQAQGILMERFSLTDSQAFNVLVRYSQTNNTRLRALAEQVVETRRLPATE